MNYFKSFLQEKEIKGLDGLRAMACLMVICSHLGQANNAGSTTSLSTMLDLGKEGVALFFVISGFIISLLLFKEKSKKCDINLKSFYFRRTIKIVPVLFAYLFFIVALKMGHIINVDSATLRSNFFFYTNYSLAPYSKYLGHIWSLAVEEHFYIFWPLLVLFLNRKGIRYLIILTIIASPLMRLLSYYLMPSMTSKLDVMTHCRIDGFMLGAALADLYETNRLEKFYKKIKNPGLILAVLLIFYVFIHPTLKMHLFKGYWILAGILINSVVGAMIIYLIIFDNKSLFHKFFNSKPMRHIGIISYSLYVWQEFCIYYFVNPLPAILSSYIMTILSFSLIEVTANKIKKRFNKRIAATGSQELVATIHST